MSITDIATLLYVNYLSFPIKTFYFHFLFILFRYLSYFLQFRNYNPDLHVTEKNGKI